MTKLLNLLWLFLVFSICAHASKPVNVLLTNTISTIEVYGPFINNISSIESNSSLLFPPDVNVSCSVLPSSVVTEPCRIQHNRTIRDCASPTNRWFLLRNKRIV